MISTFVLLTVVGSVSRLGLNWVLRRKLGVSLGLPPILALALVILTGLPDILSPVFINLPLGLVEGLCGEEKVGIEWLRKGLVRTPMGSEPNSSFLIKFS
jgi:hypothetical protein